jgi:molecular chaperone GrpE
MNKSKEESSTSDTEINADSGKELDSNNQDFKSAVDEENDKNTESTDIDREAENNSENTVDDLIKKLDEVQGEAEDNKNLYLRAIADLENFRRRAVRDKEESRRLATEALIEDVLPALDNLVLGLEAAKQHPEAKPVTEGFSMVLTQLESILQEHGIKEINPVDEKFQPDFHECVAHEPSKKYKEGKIISVIRKGYLLHDRLVRPASVIVSSGKGDKKIKQDT